MTGQNRFLLHGNAENRRWSIFATSKNSVTPNITSNSDSPSYIYPKTGQTPFFITCKCRKPAMFYFLEHQKTASHQIWPQIRISRASFTLTAVKTSFLLHGNAENRPCSILEHQKTASHRIWPQIRVSRPSFTLKLVKPRFLLHVNAENRQCSIFWNSKKRRHTKSDLKFEFPVLHLP